MKSYGYETSSNGRYVLSRDGREIMRGTEAEIWKYLHQTHSFSVTHALAWEGYTIRPEQEAPLC